LLVLSPPKRRPQSNLPHVPKKHELIPTRQPLVRPFYYDSLLAVLLHPWGDDK
jgi:hypothetical protein